jgi:hypothetical protein
MDWLSGSGVTGFTVYVICATPPPE